MPTIILFHGIGGSSESFKYLLENDIIKKYNLIEKLETIGIVYNKTIPYNNLIYYYDKKYEKLYDKVDNLIYDDLFIDKYITKFYNEIDKTIYKPPYILVCHSFGILYGIEFAKQFTSKCLFIVSLDGTRFTKQNIKIHIDKLKQKSISRETEKRSGSGSLNVRSGSGCISNINEKKFNVLVNEITSYNAPQNIQKILDFVLYINYKYAYKNNFEKLPIDMIIFRDIYANPITEKEINHNNLCNNELKKLKKINPNKITNINLPNASHFVWKIIKFRNLIVKKILLELAK